MTNRQEETLLVAHQCLTDALITAPRQETENIKEVLKWLEEEFPSLDFS